ncbi:DUF6090 family protein [Winogradskyella sp. A2]|uniref:DUF6090 family protein n=1 Tax=Winogradskyella sp. A2 TaxID=3366944 RepID=UPI00398C696B
MIKFFRKIRQRLLTENKFSKYLIYAIGEIVLVVIGILIALQVNNWNQRQQFKELSSIYIEDFKREINSDIVALSKRIASNERMTQNVNAILTTLATKNELSKEEATLFFEQNELLMRESYFIPETGAFKQLDANGNASLILSKNLRDNLYQYYTLNDRNEKNGEISTQLYQHNFISVNILSELITREFLENKIGNSLNRPRLDLETLRQSTTYLGALLAKREITVSQNRQYKNIKEKAENLLELLTSY